jgi:putative restriction endonuclease
VRYWWVNQNQTFRQEISGGYLWSPKRNANGARNPFYEFMREIAPGDLVFSFADTRLMAVGIVGSYCYESPKPREFGEIGLNWEQVGWRVRVNFTHLINKIRPKDHIDLLKPLLPPRYSPLQVSGNGIQSVYLTEVPALLAEALIGLIGVEARVVTGRAEEVSLQAETLTTTLTWNSGNIISRLPLNLMLPSLRPTGKHLSLLEGGRGFSSSGSSEWSTHVG